MPLGHRVSIPKTKSIAWLSQKVALLELNPVPSTHISTQGDDPRVRRRVDPGGTEGAPLIK